MKEHSNMLHYILNEDCEMDIQADEFVWVVSDYTIGDYCGDGTAVGLHPDGLVYIANLGHCSCYGPTEDEGLKRYGDSQTVASILDRDAMGTIGSPLLEVLVTTLLQANSLPEVSLITGVTSNPNDRLPRLIVADWFDEHGADGQLWRNLQ